MRPASPSRPARVTRPHRALVGQLERVDAFRSAGDLYHALRGAGHRIGLSTVYRRLRELTETGHVDSLRGAGGEQLFRLRRSAEHTHYLYCRRCGADVEIGEEALERWLLDVGRAHGYTGLLHDLVLSGVCPGCTARGVADSDDCADPGSTDPGRA